MENKEKAVKEESTKLAEVFDAAKKDAQLYNFASVALQSYIDGLKAALKINKSLDFAK